MSVEQVIIDTATNAAAEPVQAVVVDATGSTIKRVIIEKVTATGMGKPMAIVGTVMVVAGASYLAHKGYKYFKARKASKAAQAAE